MFRTADEAIAAINAFGYLIQGISQSHYSGWDVYVRSPFDWHVHRFAGSTMVEACDKAAVAMQTLGKAQPFTKAQKRAVVGSGRVRLAKQRVKLTKARTRL